jgi:WD40 repeat protein
MESNPPGFTLLQTLRGGKRHLTRLAWLPVGTTIGAASYDQTVRLWDMATPQERGKERQKFIGHSGTVFALAASADGRFLLSSSKNALKFWPLTADDKPRTLRGHTDYIYSIAITPDSQTAVSAAFDQMLLVWDLATDTPRHRLTGHRGRVNGVVVLPDGVTAVSGGADGQLRFWQLQEGKLIAQVAAHKKEVLSLAVRAGGGLLASGGQDGRIHLWDTATTKAVHALDGHREAVTGLSFSGDGRLLASKSADGTVRLWRSDSWETAAILPEPHSGTTFAGLAFHPSQPILATLGEEDTAVRLWQLDLGTVIGNR